MTPRIPRALRALTSLLVLAAAAAAPAPAAAQQRNLPPFVELPGRMELRGVLVARPLQAADAEALGLSAAELRDRARSAADLARAYELERYVPETDEYLIRVPAGESESSVAARLIATGDFQYVEPDWRVFPIGCTSDPLFGNQWHHAANRMQSCDAWAIGSGDPSIVVAICDTGVRTSHEDLQLHRMEGFHAPSATWESQGGPITDINGHGTRTTGCAAANGDNNVGVAGTAWNLSHRMMRVTDSSGGGAFMSDLTLAARTAADAGDKVASVSYEGVTESTVQTTGQYCRDRGALLVWAAGNSNSNLGGNRDDAVIVVGATDQADNKASFSSFGTFVDLFAPGVDIYSPSDSSDSSYSGASGTSFATPLTAGLIGMIWSADPGRSPTEVEDILRATCDDIGAMGEDDVFGFGRINSFKAMQVAQPPILIGYPNGRPDYVDPGGSTELTVSVAPGTDAPVPGSGVLYSVAGGPLQQTPLVETAPGIYTALFPQAPCGADVDWFVRFDLAGGGTHSSPGGAPADTWHAVAYIVTGVLADDLEGPSSWTVGAPGDNATTGTWAHVDPNGTEAQPGDDHTPGSGTMCWVTGQGAPGGGQGDNDVDGGTTTLLTDVYDLSGLDEPVISYWRWYANDTGASPSTDVFVVGISNDGGTSWSTVETVGPTGAEASGGWFQHQFMVSDIVAPTSQVRLRFVASDLGSGSIVEAAIDDLEIVDFACGAMCGPMSYCTSDPNSSGQPGLIAASGSFYVSDNAFQLSASQLPPGQLGIFYYGGASASVAFGNGTRCVGSPFFRLPVVAIDGAGQVSYTPDLTMPPGPAGQITQGSTWYFQFWFRDPAAGGANFDLTDGVSVTFCPE